MAVSEHQLEAEGRVTREAAQSSQLAVQARIDVLHTSLTRMETAVSSGIAQVKEEMGKMLLSGDSNRAALTVTVNEAAARVEKAVTEAGGSAVEAKQAAAATLVLLNEEVLPQVST